MSHTRWARIAFLVTVAIKGIDGIIETILGLFIALVGPDKLLLLVLRFTVPELHNNPANNVAEAVQSGAAKVTTIGTFAIVYLLVHGILKAGIAVDLLRGKRWIFAPAILILSGFVLFLGYRTVQQWSVWSCSLALFDLFTVTLVINEWRQPHAQR